MTDRSLALIILALAFTMPAWGTFLLLFCTHVLPMAFDWWIQHLAMIGTLPFWWVRP